MTAVVPAPAVRTDTATHAGRRSSPLAMMAYAVAAAGSATTAALLHALVPSVGPVVWTFAALVALTLLATYVTTPPYERLRSGRVARRVLLLACAALIAGAASGAMSVSDLRASLVVVGVPAVLLFGALVLNKAVRTGRSVVLVGDHDSVGHLLAQWRSRPEVEVVGVCLTGTELPLDLDTGGVSTIIATMDDTMDVVHRTRADLVVVAPGPELSAYDVRRIGWGLERTGVEMTVAAEMHGAVPHRVQPRLLANRLLFSVRPAQLSPLQRMSKALFDRVVGACLLLVLSPLLAVLMILVRRDSSGPALFVQTRAGLDGRPFRMYKLRTMVIDAEDRLAELHDSNEGAGPLFKMAEDPRVTRVGRFLRRSSLDELPQLINVVRGEMSLIGPRPALLTEAEQYDPWIRRRLAAKPGMTGLWQVSGRSRLGWNESVRLDLDYVDNGTIWDDLTIAVRTARAVTQRDGAS